jgi:cytochrome c peroxidase
MDRWLELTLAVGIAFGAADRAAAEQAPRTDATAHFRRPVALAVSKNGKWVFTANERSGTVSVLDMEARKLAGEFAIGRRLADLAVVPDAGLAVIDEETSELLVLEWSGSTLEIVNRLRVAATPVSIRVAADSRLCTVASLWSRRLSVVKLPEPGRDKRARLVRSIELPFPPRQQLWLPQPGKLVVADAFAGRLVIVNAAEGRLESVRSIPGHNIRGLCLSPENQSLLVAQQILNPLGTSSFDDIHWGNLMTNDLRELLVADLLRPGGDALRTGRLEQLGDIGRGAADPAAVAVLPSGKTLITLSGVDEIALSSRREAPWQRLAVGKRPTAIALSRDRHWAFVANTLSDTVSIVDCHQDKIVDQIPLGPCPEPGPAERGEIFFHSARLAHDGWLSCQSCHPDGHTTGLLNDNLTDGSFATPKRILSLRGVRDTAPYAWNGRMPDLETQVRQSITSTMQGPRPAEQTVRELAGYLRTLPPPPRAADLQCSIESAAVERGKQVFEHQACGKCHTPPSYTSSRTYDVGLTDEAGHRLFNPPSLRGVRHGGPFFHDGRAASLKEVLERYRHQLKSQLTKAEVEDMLQFLLSL